MRQAECRLRCLPPKNGRLFVTRYRSVSSQIISSPSVTDVAVHIRSTLRDNRSHRRSWDNYPNSVPWAKTVVFVRDGNSAVTVTLLTRNHTDTPRRWSYIDVCELSGSACVTVIFLPSLPTRYHLLREKVGAVSFLQIGMFSVPFSSPLIVLWFDFPVLHKIR